MLEGLKLRLLDRLATRGNYDVSYMKMMLKASPRGFGRFVSFMKILKHREALPLEPFYAAQLVGTLAEDCGPCTQIVTDMAHGEGMRTAQIAAVLKAEVPAMSEEVALAYRFARAVIAISSDLEESREAVRARWGDKGLVELTFAAQMSRVIPMVKRGLGYAQDCRQVSVGGEPMWVRQKAA